MDDVETSARRAVETFFQGWADAHGYGEGYDPKSNPLYELNVRLVMQDMKARA